MKDQSITFRLPEDEKKMLRDKAEELDVPISQLIREALRAYYNSQEVK